MCFMLQAIENEVLCLEPSQQNVLWKMFSVRSMRRHVSVRKICIGSVRPAINYLYLLSRLVLEQAWLAAARRGKPAAMPRNCALKSWWRHGQS